MTSQSKNLLTPGDLWCVSRGSVPPKADPAIAQKTTDGRVVFSMRGLQLYSAVCAKYGLQDAFATAETWEQYVALKADILSRCTRRAEGNLKNALKRGEIPLQRREAAYATLRGDLAEAQTAKERLRSCAAAGSHVMPIGVAKK